MTALALALHILGAVVWVGGMFAIYVCLRPALGTLEPPQRLRLMRVTFQKFFPWVWLAILLLLASGYWMLFMTFGGFVAASLYTFGLMGARSKSSKTSISGMDQTIAISRSKATTAICTFCASTRVVRSG